MRSVLYGFGISLLLLACGDKAKHTPEPDNTSSEKLDTPQELQQKPTNPIDLRALFYLERKDSKGGVAAFPATSAPTLSDGDTAWLEVHTKGANYAYAFAFLADERILPLWSEEITQIKHTPPMRAFGDGLSLSSDFDPPTKLVVIATESALADADQITDCQNDNLAVCDQLRNIADLDVQSNRGGTNKLKMRFGEISVGAYGDSAQGEDVVAIAFAFMAPTSP